MSDQIFAEHFRSLISMMTMKHGQPMVAILVTVPANGGEPSMMSNLGDTAEAMKLLKFVVKNADNAVESTIPGRTVN